MVRTSRIAVAESSRYIGNLPLLAAYSPLMVPCDSSEYRVRKESMSPKLSCVRRFPAVLVLCLLVCTLSACGPSKKEQEDVARWREESEAVAAMVKAPVEPRIVQVGEHQLVVVEVPFSEFGLLNQQRCFVWRDAEYKTASLSCEDQTRGKVRE